MDISFIELDTQARFRGNCQQPVTTGLRRCGHLQSVYAVIMAFELVIYHVELPRTKDSERLI